jgi:capsular polysaccharide biosynthesis protein
MEVLTQVQAIVMEHAFTIGIGLLITLIVSGIVWFYMLRSSPVSKENVLVNQARMNEATMNPELQESRQEEVEQQGDAMMHQEEPVMDQ